MGNSFTSTHIYDNECLSKEQFIKKFCEKMYEDGYVICDNNESELSYILKFAVNCKWVTIASEAYEQGNALSHKDAGRISKMLETICVNTVVIDNDCAIIELYNKNGKKADTLTIGRADDYFGDDIPQPSENIWKPFLCNNSTWELFHEVRNGDYVFVEEGLSKFAPVIGMDACNITFAAEDADESDKNVVFLDFKKDRSTITVSQGEKATEKALSLNEAFKKIYGAELEPMGFVYAKTQNPCFLRAVNDDIVHIICLADNGSSLSILSGAFTLYRKCIDLNDHKTDNWWLRNTADFYVAANPHEFDNNYRSQIITFQFEKAKYLSVYSAVEGSLIEVKKWVLKVLDSVSSLKEFVYYQKLVNIPQEYFAVCDKIRPESIASCSDAAMVFALEDPFFVPKYVKEQTLSYAKYALEKNIDNFTEERYDALVQRVENKYDKVYELISYVINNHNFYEQTLQELERRKAENRKVLKKYGINF